MKIEEKIRHIEEYEITEPEIKKIFLEIFNSEKFELFPQFFKRIKYFFLSSNENIRDELINFFSNYFYNLNLEEILVFCKNSLIGNLIWLKIFSEQKKIVYSTDEKYLLLIKDLEFKEEIFYLDLNLNNKIILALDESISHDLIKLAEALMFLFHLGLLELSKDTIKSFYYVYSKCMNKSKDFVLKTKIIESLLNNDEDEFIKYINMISDQKINSLIEMNLEEIYIKLQKIDIPVFFERNKIKFNGRLYNGNFFFLKYKDKIEQIKILWPFSQVDLVEVKKTYDMFSHTWLTPKERFGKISINEIYDFKEVSKIKIINSKDKISKIGEDEIINLIRFFIGDSEKTTHGPLEKADIFTTKIRVNNERDIRNAAFIVKGPSFKNVTLKEVAHQILKACNLPVDIVILVYVGNITDEVKEHFINTCNLTNKMYSFFNRDDICKLAEFKKSMS